MFDAATSNFDGLNYLTPDDFRLSIQSVAGGFGRAVGLSSIFTHRRDDDLHNRQRRRSRANQMAMSSSFSVTSIRSSELPDDDQGHRAFP